MIGINPGSKHLGVSLGRGLDWAVGFGTTQRDDLSPFLALAIEMNMRAFVFGLPVPILSNLDAIGNISYAFNSYYQIHNQLDSACRFPNLSTITTKDPSVGDCQFRIMIQTLATSAGGNRLVSIKTHVDLVVIVFTFLFTIL
ncbi:hypothetical protein Dsin_004412 [Dipteronia sinensis]|uniref:X8 domain-containing protein n=1 Tax=Dipteronia sinensis TaxID=43782 RepID=A0AAE0B9V8_9ROSI|nr:hypothetical protein Dsin_004412 [Dipteronia sinensis]